MSLQRLMVHDVTILHAGIVTDRYGNQTKDWASATSVAVKGWIAQQDRSEIVEGREAEVSRWIAYLPAGTVVAGGDRIQWNNPTPAITLEVDGPPNIAWTPRGEHHVEATLLVVTG